MSLASLFLDRPAGGLDSPAHPAIVAAWVRGWALTREVTTPVPHETGWRVQVGLPNQQARYVFPHVSDALRQLGETIVDPWVFLKACAPLAALRAALPSRWILQPEGFMMTCGAAAFDVSAPLAAGYGVEVIDVFPRAHVSILASDGSLAASGHLALDAEYAIYDRIVTQPEHQRRGLGRHVMRTLQGVGHDHGRRRGVLVASSQGRLLYESLGWRLDSTFATAVIPQEMPR